MPEALIAFAGVALGIISTSLLTIYKESLTLRKERESRVEQRLQVRLDGREAFQRESILALQEAVTDLIKSVYDEQDQMVIKLAETSEWPARRWTTPTARGWTDAELRLAQLQSRVFDDELRQLSKQIRRSGREGIWAPSLTDAQEANRTLKEAADRFDGRAAKILPSLFEIDPIQARARGRAMRKVVLAGQRGVVTTRRWARAGESGGVVTVNDAGAGDCG